MVPNEILKKEFKMLAYLPDFLELELDVLDKVDILKKVPKSYSAFNQSENFHFFLDKGKWVHQRFDAVVEELSNRGLISQEKSLIKEIKTEFNFSSWKIAKIYNDWSPTTANQSQNQQYIEELVRVDKRLSTKIPIYQLSGKSIPTSAASMSFPLIFMAWNYYSTDSFLGSAITTLRDFLWPAACVVAKSMNASPYQMLFTNVAGIGWTIYNCFFSDYHEETIKKEETTSNYGSQSLKDPITASLSSPKKQKRRFIARIKHKWQNKRMQIAKNFKNRQQKKQNVFARMKKRVINRRISSKWTIYKQKRIIARKEKSILKSIKNRNSITTKFSALKNKKYQKNKS